MNKRSDVNQLVDNLFRHESGKIVSVLTRIFGIENLTLVEDVVQDALIEAIKNWTYHDVPTNPSAWLMTVAKNKAFNILKREKHKYKHRGEITQFLQSESTAQPTVDPLFSDVEILDDQLRMIFTCSHPSISYDSQIALTLKTLCGFSIPEIAHAFLTTEDNINKRLVRARKTIREANVSFEVPVGDALARRVDTVVETIYLLFNEGYSASSGQKIIKFDVCKEAIRLAEIIAQHAAIPNKTNVYALLALMQLNASRFEARQDTNGNIITLEHQDRSKWDYKLMKGGFTNLDRSTYANEVSKYHLLATISAYHCTAKDYISTDWKSILTLYDRLLTIDNSPLILLNRAIALSKVEGVKSALVEIETIKRNDQLKKYHLLYSTQAELLIEAHEFKKAVQALQASITLAPLDSEKVLLQKRLTLCKQKII